MCAQGIRQSDRVSVAMTLEGMGRDIHGQEFTEQVRTLLICRNGAAIVLRRRLAAEQELILRRRFAHKADQEGRVRVVGEIGEQSDGYAYGVAILDPSTDLWGIKFPPVAESEDAVARMLLECSYCQSREVGYLNEFELKEFETQKAIARHCMTCLVPTIWTQAALENASKPPRSQLEREPWPNSGPVLPDSAQAGRKNQRMKTRLTACVRQAGLSEELAVCENMSRGGLCFRSRRRYEEGTQIEIAVPYAKGGANIFIPVKIVHVQKLATAGLFRHGAEYIRNQDGQPKD